jgi:hypothetical protein
MVRIIDCIFGKFLIAFFSEVRLWDQHDFYAVERDKCFQFFCILYQVVGVPQGEL